MQLEIFWLILATLTSNHLRTGYTKSHDPMELKMVQVLFRHGERAPQKIEYDVLHYLNVSVYEPFGLDQLTNTGKMQAYKIGTMLRERYKNFLNDKRASRNIYARSSEDVRTRMTLQLVLAGLFPPSKELRWHPTLDWMPIAYRYVPKELDALLKTQNTDKFLQISQDVWKMTSTKEKLALYEDIFNLMDKVGIKVSRSEIIDLVPLHNVLLIHERMNLPLPEWYTKEIKTKFQQAFEFFHDSRSYTQKMKRLNGGPVIKTFIDNFNHSVSIENPRKFYLYSGHDMNVAAVIRALNVDGFGDSDFCSTLIFEKWRDSENQVFVRLLHWNGVKEEMNSARIGKCEEFCPFDNFLNLTREVIPSDEELFSLYDQYDKNYVKKFFP